jgi:hypothetical protein
MQAYIALLLWCAVRPFAYYLTRSSTNNNDTTDDAPSPAADFGLVLYGLVGSLWRLVSGGRQQFRRRAGQRHGGTRHCPSSMGL